MLTHLDPASALAFALLVFALIMVILFEATNGFHDAANAVATVIYTRSLQAGQAIVLSGVLNFLGVMVGGIAVAYALVELLPAEVLSPPGGGPAVAMLLSLFIAALFWNIGTWWLGLPNSSSHCLIGALIGVALGNALVRARSLGEGVHWGQLWTVLEALALSPVLGLVLAGALYFGLQKTIHDRHLYEPAGDHPPVWWMRGLQILTCTGVSFAHGTNDGQKSIGLIMLTLIGLFPAAYALNPEAGDALKALPGIVEQARPLIESYGDDERPAALSAAETIRAHSAGDIASLTLIPASWPTVGPANPAAQQRATMRDDIYRIISELKFIGERADVGEDDKASAAKLAKQLGDTVEYAPWWVRILSAVCLGIGTMIGYRRIVTTLGERLGNVHMTPAQGAAAETVSAVLIGIAGFTGLPVSTTHIVTSGISGTMVAAHAGLRWSMLSRIAIAWLLTLPVTIVIAGGIYYLLADPGL